MEKRIIGAQKNRRIFFGQQGPFNEKPTTMVIVYSQDSCPNAAESYFNVLLICIEHYRKIQFKFVLYDLHFWDIQHDNHFLGDLLS